MTNKERVDRLTWYAYITSATTDAERLQRWRELADYLPKSRWS